MAEKWCKNCENGKNKMVRKITEGCRKTGRDGRKQTKKRGPNNINKSFNHNTSLEPSTASPSLPPPIH